MNRKLCYSLLAVVMVATMVLSACGPAPVAATPVTVIQTKEVPVQVVVTATTQPKAKQLEIFHWWTAPGEREAADAMFAAMKAAYPDVQIVENPVPGGGGTEHRVVLKAR